MEFTDNEKRTIKATFGELLKKPYSELNCFLGSLTIEEMQKLRYKKYCRDNGISYDDMAQEDFIAGEEEMHDVCECEEE